MRVLKKIRTRLADQPVGMHMSGGCNEGFGGFPDWDNIQPGVCKGDLKSFERPALGALQASIF
jgi:hypothetical protein